MLQLRPFYQQSTFAAVAALAAQVPTHTHTNNTLNERTDITYSLYSVRTYMCSDPSCTCTCMFRNELRLKVHVYLSGSLILHWQVEFELSRKLIFRVQAI